MVCFGNAEQPPGSPYPVFLPKLRIELRLKGAATIPPENERGRENCKAFFLISFA